MITPNYAILRPINLSLHHINAEIRALVQQGFYLEAVESFSKQPNFPNNTSKFVFPSVLKACASLSNFRCGRTLHSIIIKMGLEYDSYITTSLVHMYVKCGSISSAVKLFDSVSNGRVLVQDVVLWNSIINGLFKNGIFGPGMVLFRQMQALNVKPDGYTFCILLGRCNRVLGIAYGIEIHGYVVRNALDDDPFVVTAMIDMYSNFNRPLDAWYVFEKLDNKYNIAVWNAMITGFCENGLWRNGLQLYSQAKSERLELGSTTFSIVLTACSQVEDLGVGCQLHCDVVKEGLESDPYVRTSLITFYAKCQLLKDAERVFYSAVDNQVEIWNSMISAYVNHGCANDALHIYHEMHFRLVAPDSLTISNTLVASSMVRTSYLGRMIHGELIKKPIMNSVMVQSALLTMYSKHGSLEDAHKVFSEMREKDVVAWGSMISGACEDRKFQKALHLYKAMESEDVKPDANVVATAINACIGLGDERLGCCIHGLAIKKGLDSDSFTGSSLIDFYARHGLPDMAKRSFSNVLWKNLVVWNSLISCYRQNGLPGMSIILFHQILEHGLYPDAVSITSVLPAVSLMAAFLQGKAIHCYYIKLQIPKEIQAENAFIDMYIKCGCLKYAQHMFQNMTKRNIESWNSVIAGFGSYGKCHKAIDLFHEMTNSGTVPDEITFLSLISSCNHCGFIDEGLEIFQSMKEHRIEIKMDHYITIVDLLGRAGRLYDAYNIIENMTMAPDRGVWQSLLSACRVHCNIELGELAADKLIKMDPTRGSNYIQILNLYVETGQHEKAAKLRALMKSMGLRKIPGCSWIEMKNKIDIFYSGDSSSPSTIEIYETLDNLKKYMKRKECVLEAGELMYEPV